MATYQSLKVWQRSIELVEEVYKVATQLPQAEIYGLTSQMKRSAISIPSNIAEGQKRLNNTETTQFTGIALGSLAELETQLILAEKLYKINVGGALRLCTEVGKMSTGLIKSLRVPIVGPTI